MRTRVSRARVVQPRVDKKNKMIKRVTTRLEQTVKHTVVVFVVTSARARTFDRLCNVTVEDLEGGEQYRAV